MLREEEYKEQCEETAAEQCEEAVAEPEQYEDELAELEHVISRKERLCFYLYGVLSALALMVVAAAVVLGINYFSSRSGGQNAGAQSGGSQSAGGDSVVSATLFQKIQAIEDTIKSQYYRDEDIDSAGMEAGIYKGMIEALGDPYSTYYTPEELAALMDKTEGIYYGIGAGVSLDTVTGYPKISKVYSNTPAEEAGLRGNDIIYEVEGETTYGLELTEVVNRIKGEEGTWVKLTIYREGQSDYLYIDVQRRKVNIPTIEWQMLEGDVAYIQIAEFDEVTVSQFKEALDGAKAQGMKGLIIDLRGNPGGSLDAVVGVCNEILPEGLIVYTEDKYGNRKEYKSDGKNKLQVPLAVLIDGNSASASEILAGAVKDYELGTLVGTTTYGKGIVQMVIPISDGSALKLTISSYFTPKGNNIHNIGVEPDVECLFDGEAYYTDPARPDNQLEKAHEVVLQQIKQ